MIFNQAIDRFIDELAQTVVPANVYNQYCYDAEANAVRRANLRLYLQQMKAHSPRVLLVGEAAGHRGCRLSGVPFTSEDLLLRGIASHALFGKARGYRKSGEWPRQVKESSATIVWDVIERQPQPPLLWNILPYHPHSEAQKWSNRTPRLAEIDLGKPFLLHLIDLFVIERIVAVGRKAALGLTRWGMAHDHVRHPSHGGKGSFSRGVALYLRG